MVKVVNTDKAPAAIGPYVQGVDLGNMLFASGQIPINPATGEMPTCVKEQAKQSLANVKAIITLAPIGANEAKKLREVFLRLFLLNFPIFLSSVMMFFYLDQAVKHSILFA